MMNKTFLLADEETLDVQAVLLVFFINSILSFFLSL